MIRDKFANLMGTLVGSSHLSKIEQQIDKLYSKTAVLPDFKRNWAELIRALAGNNDQAQKVLQDITNPLTQQAFQLDIRRIERYNNMQQLARKVPIIEKAVRIFVANILAPDDITKTSLVVKTESDLDDTNNDELTILKDELKNIIKHFKLNKILRNILHDTLLLGDTFVEIVPVNLVNFFKQHTNVINESITLETKINGFNSGNEKLSINVEIIDYTAKNTATLLDEQLGKYKSYYDYINEAVSSAGLLPGGKERYDLYDIYLRIHEPQRVIVLTNSDDLLLGYLVIKPTSITPINYTFRTFTTQQQQNIILKKTLDTITRRIEDKIISMLQSKFDDIDIPDDLHQTLYKIIMDRDSRFRNIQVKFVPPELIQHFKYPSTQFKPYGESYLLGLYYIASLLLTRIISSTIYKVARSGKHLVFYVDSSNARDAAQRIERIKEQTKRMKVTSSDLESVETIPSLISTFDDFYIPTIDGKRLVEIDTLDFSDAVKDRDDMDNTIMKQILTGIDIPPPFLGIEENVNAKATLTHESVIFARSIVDLQMLFSDQVSDLARKIHTLTSKKPNPFINDVYITFPPPMGIVAQTYADMYQQINTIKDVLTGFDVPIEYIRNRFLSDINWEQITLQKMKKEIKSKTSSEETGEETGEEYPPASNQSEMPPMGGGVI